MSITATTRPAIYYLVAADQWAYDYVGRRFSYKNLDQEEGQKSVFKCKAIGVCLCLLHDEAYTYTYILRLSPAARGGEYEYAA